MKTIAQSLALTLVVIAQLLQFPLIAGAAQCPDDSFLGLPAWYTYLQCDDDSAGRISPTIESSSDALPIGIAVLEGMIRLGGLVAVVMVFIGAFNFITSQGNSENAASARKTVINALIGLVIVIIATSIVSFIGNSVGVA